MSSSLVQRLLGLLKNNYYIFTKSTVAVSNIVNLTSGKALPSAVDIFKVFLVDPPSQKETLR
ncbi:MAG TPA: hypothetical protein VE956_16985 [Nodularia sp. (in: cyanobacteria)]|nr:hypothetical protein [Nodularia sp. (in: cyanobacteria)]